MATVLEGDYHVLSWGEMGDQVLNIGGMGCVVISFC